MVDPRPLLDSYPLYIDGRWVDPESGRYDDISAATEATIAQAPDAGLADVDGAIDAVGVARRMRTGQIAVNGCIPGDAPFGGFKQSGLDREGGGLPGLHRYIETKAIGIPA
jgi:acyl-CoA reductase-like NAD-dependent aldehyde dehydrogenase